MLIWRNERPVLALAKSILAVLCLMAFRRPYKILELRRQMTQNSSAVNLAVRTYIKIVGCEANRVCPRNQYSFTDHASYRFTNNCVASSSPTILVSCRISLSNVNVSVVAIHANFLENLQTKTRCFFSRFSLILLGKPDFFQIVLITASYWLVDGLCKGFHISCQGPERPISTNPGLNFLPLLVFTFLCIA